MQRLKEYLQKFLISAGLSGSNDEMLDFNPWTLKIHDKKLEKEFVDSISTKRAMRARFFSIVLILISLL